MIWYRAVLWKWGSWWRKVHSTLGTAVSLHERELNKLYFALLLLFPTIEVDSRLKRVWNEALKGSKIITP